MIESATSGDRFEVKLVPMPKAGPEDLGSNASEYKRIYAEEAGWNTCSLDQSPVLRREDHGGRFTNRVSAIGPLEKFMAQRGETLCIYKVVHRKE